MDEDFPEFVDHIDKLVIKDRTVVPPVFRLKERKTMIFLSEAARKVFSSEEFGGLVLDNLDDVTHY